MVFYFFHALKIVFKLRMSQGDATFIKIKLQKKHVKFSLGNHHWLFFSLFINDGEKNYTSSGNALPRRIHNAIFIVRLFLWHLH